MGYTLCKLVQFDEQANWEQDFFFHPGDVERVMNQEGAEKQLIVRIRGIASGKQGFGLIGATVDTKGDVDTRLDGDNHIIALPCYPWNDDEHYFDEAP